MRPVHRNQEPVMASYSIENTVGLVLVNPLVQSMMTLNGHNRRGEASDDNAWTSLTE
ncbi:hypothetical protein COMA2_160003 [Candidatus Nitrospira nitrificans]|uniref:Uncharacterized protein n=1 Tax=Candidatus Nitrospira nitrificans TaxID=1742973 RepID=A0A0S4LC74_9BACT|nr:hypothetical protein COMA2_160003 [Candidatus Nitrospira nitrificans]